MALRFQFKRGKHQALEASRYFMSLCTELVEENLPNRDAGQYLVNDSKEAMVPMRLWSESTDQEELVRAVLPWVTLLCQRMLEVELHPTSEEHMRKLVHTAMEMQSGAGTLFLELLHPEHAFTEDENNLLSLGVIAGGTVMLSSRTIIFVQLAPDLFGLSIAERGSYSIEVLREEEPVEIRSFRSK